MKKLKELIDLEKLQELTDQLYLAAGIPSAIIAMDGEVLTGSGWQRICTEFHRKHPQIEQDCIASDIAIRDRAEAGEPFRMYTCPRGLTDASIPIVIEGEHLANAFAGQLFLEQPTAEVEQQFREQARRYGLDEEAYMQAFREVPVMPRARFRSALLFLAKLAQMIAEMGLKRIRELESRTALEQSEEKFRTLFENMAQGVFYQRADDSLVDCNSVLLEMFGLTREEFLGRDSTHADWCVYGEDGAPIPAEQHPSVRALRTGKPVLNATLAVFNPRRQALVWLDVNAIPQFRPGEQQPHQVFVTLHEITDRKQAEKTLVERERLLRELADNYPNSYVSIVERDYTVGFTSGQEFNKRGLDPDAFVGMTLDEVFAEHAAFVKQQYARVFAGEEVTFELFYDEQHQSYKATPLRDGDGRINRILAVVENITDRKKAELALKESEARFRGMFQRHSAVMLLIEPESGQIVDANAAAEGFYRENRDALLRKTIQQINALPAEAVSRARRMALKGELNAFVFPHRLADDQVRQVEVYSSPIEVEGRALLFSIIHDVTERERKDREREALLDALESSERRLRDSQRIAGMGDVVWDLESNRVSWSEGVHHLLQTDPAEIDDYGKASAAACHPDDLEQIKEWFTRSVQSGEERLSSREFRVVRKDREVLHVQVGGAIIRRDGRPSRILATVHDISERRKVEAQLVQADRLSSMGLLAAGVAHEINNPLAYVLYNLQCLGEELPDVLASVRQLQAQLSSRAGGQQAAESFGNLMQRLNPMRLQELQEQLDSALEGTYRIRDVSRGLGTFSRVEREGQVPVNLMHVMDAARKMAHNEIKYRARLVTDYCPDLPTVVANEGQLSQVFLNLIINAVHAIDEGEIESNEIRLRTWADEVAVYAEVRDTGAGIPAEHLRRIFDPFFTTKKAGLGSGLGLPLSKSIVESHGGSIAVDSEPGRGTSVTIRLPLREQEEAAPEEAALRPAARTGERGRILIVDDEAPVRKALQKILCEHDVVVAASGEEARGVLRSDQAFDVILCDMMMPDLSGMDLHAWLMETHPALAGRVIFVTGGAFTPRASEYLRCVDNPQLEKPLDVAKLRQIVAERIKLARGELEGERGGEGAGP